VLQRSSAVRVLTVTGASLLRCDRENNNSTFRDASPKQTHTAPPHSSQPSVSGKQSPAADQSDSASESGVECEDSDTGSSDEDDSESRPDSRGAKDTPAAIRRSSPGGGCSSHQVCEDAMRTSGSESEGWNSQSAIDSGVVAIELSFLQTAYHDGGRSGKYAQHPTFRRRLVRLLLRKLHYEEQHADSDHTFDSGSDTECALNRIFRAWPKITLSDKERAKDLHQQRQNTRRRLQEELRNAKQAAADAGKARDVAESQLQRAKQQIARLRKEVDDLHGQLAAVEVENARLKQSASSSAFAHATSSKPSPPSSALQVQPSGTPSAGQLMSPLPPQVPATTTPRASLPSSPHTPLRTPAANNATLSPELLVQQLVQLIQAGQSTPAASVSQTPFSLTFASSDRDTEMDGEPLTPVFSSGTSSTSGSARRSGSVMSSRPPGSKQKRQPTPEGFKYAGIKPNDKHRRRLYACLQCDHVITGSDMKRLLSHLQHQHGHAAIAQPGDGAVGAPEGAEASAAH